MAYRRLNLMWGRTVRHVVVITALLSSFFISSRILKAIISNSDEGTPSLLTKEQLEILRAFDLPVGEAEHEQNKITSETEKKKDFGNSPAKSRSDSLISNIQTICRSFNVTLPLTSYMLAHMHFDEKHEVIYCFVPKVACTSWKRIWMKMTNIVKPDKDLSEISRYMVHTSIPTLASTKKNISEILSKYKKFMFVRHPFDRVLSAYKDKLEHVDKESSYDFHKQIGVQIQKKYRPHDRNFTGKDVTFPEFIRFISEPVHGTFEQRNEHWLSTHEICNPCAVKYDFIGKYENLKEDAHYVLDWVGASDLIKDFPVSDRPWHAKRYDPKYFNQLNYMNKMSFFQKYLLDFVAFNYTFI